MSEECAYVSLGEDTDSAYEWHLGIRPPIEGWITDKHTNLALYTRNKYSYVLLRRRCFELSKLTQNSAFFLIIGMIATTFSTLKVTFAVLISGRSGETMLNLMVSTGDVATISPCALYWLSWWKDKVQHPKLFDARQARLCLWHPWHDDRLSYFLSSHDEKFTSKESVKFSAGCCQACVICWRDRTPMALCRDT